MAPKENTATDNSKNSIDQIRDIIFGDEILQLQKDIQQLKQEYKNMNLKITALENKYNEAIAENAKIHHNANTNIKEIQKQIERTKSELAQKIKKLSESKVDKGQIGQAFIEWGQKVKED